MNKVALKDIAKQISSGLTPLRSNEEFWSSQDVPWVKTEQLGVKHIYDSNEKISKAALEKTSLKLNPINSLSIAMYGEGKTRGSLSVLKKEMATNQACCNIVIDEKKADYEYVYYFLKTQYKELRNLSSGVRKNLNSNDIKNFEIRVPECLNSQKTIAVILSNLDKKIEINNKVNAELEAMAKMIYDYWFVQFDFPDANGKPYKSSGGKMVYNEVLKREVPEGWIFGLCSDLFEFNPKLSITKGTISSHIDMNSIPTSGFMTKKPKKKEFSGGMKFQNGDVVIARITPCLENGKTGLISLLDENEIGFGSTEFVVLRGKKFDLRCFGASLARSEKFRKYAISKMTGTSGRKRVNHTALEGYQLAIPTDSLLRSFEGKVTPFFEKMTANTKENQGLVELRDWLLPMLMNGQVTVKPSQANDSE